MNTILEKIYKAGLKFLVPLSPEETYKLIVEETKKLIKADYGHILLFDGNELQRVYASSSFFYKIKNRKRGFMFNVFKKRKPLVLSIKSVVGIHPDLEKLKVKSIAGVPLYNQSKSMGVLGMLSTKKDFFSETEINSLKLLSPLASLAIRKAQLYDEIKNALQARDLFISMAAHELRTPITTISGYSQLLYSKFGGADTPEAKWVEDLSWECVRLTHLVNELLAVDNIKKGRFHYVWRECHLKEVIRHALADFRFTHPKHGVVFQDKIVDNKDIIIGDSDKLLQLVINVLDNSAKFSPADKEIIVRLRSTSYDLSLIIKDQGRGVIRKDMSKIFDKFYKGTNHAIEGMGLGLFLANNIVKEHHGSMNIYSRENQGTTIEIKLPRKRDAE